MKHASKPVIQRAVAGKHQASAVTVTDRLFTTLVALVVGSMLLPVTELAVPAAVSRFEGPTASQPLALTADNAFLAVANTDNNSVSFFDLRSDRNRKLAEVPVQVEPSSVAFLPDGSKAYVANTASGTVSVMRTNLANGAIGKPTAIAVGVEPVALVLTPNGRKLYVANARSHTVSVIDTSTDSVVRTLFNVGTEPRGLAVSNNGDASDDDETLYITQFLAMPLPGKTDGADDAKAARLTLVSTGSDSVLGEVQVNPLADTGFKALGDALARVAPGDPADLANFRFKTGAYPNQLANVALKGGFAYLPSTGASPNGPVRFDVNTHSLLSVIDRTSRLDTGRTINLHRAVADQPNPDRLFVTQPWAMAFKHHATQGFVVSAASNHVVKVEVDPATGAATVQRNPADTTRVLQIPVGQNPRGIVINSIDSRAYVLNQVSRSVSVIDLGASPEQVMATMASARLPLPGTLDEKIHIGRALYNTSIGVFDPPTGSTVPITGRMSNRGWGSCAACHTPAALSDNVVWIFGSGPRRTLSQHADFDPTVADRSRMRVLNWSAERDEQEDFELNIRAVSGGLGLIVGADGVTPDAAVTNLTPAASGGRRQLTVNGVGAWDAIKAYIQFGVRAPLSPASPTTPDIIAGRALFSSANCQQCHGGAQWTRARVRFTPPPGAGVTITAGQVVNELSNVGSFDAAAVNEVRANATAPLGAAGFAPPSLMSIHAFPQTFLHNGAASSLDQVLNNVAHRSAGTGGVDTLSNASDRARIVQFLRSIDGRTTPFP